MGHQGFNFVTPMFGLAAGIGLGQHHHRRNFGQPHQRQITFEATQVVVVVQPHHQQCGIDIADDHHARDFVAPVVQAARNLRERWYTGVRPPFAVHVALCQNPIAHRQRIGISRQGVEQSRQRARAVFMLAVVQRQAFALHFGDAQHLVKFGQWCQVQKLLEDRRRETNATQLLKNR